MRIKFICEENTPGGSKEEGKMNKELPQEAYCRLYGIDACLSVALSVCKTVFLSVSQGEVRKRGTRTRKYHKKHITDFLLSLSDSQ